MSCSQQYWMVTAYVQTWISLSLKVQIKVCQTLDREYRIHIWLDSHYNILFVFVFVFFPSENTAPTSLPSAVDPNGTKRNLELETFLLAFLTVKVRSRDDDDDHTNQKYIMIYVSKIFFSPYFRDSNTDLTRSVVVAYI